MASSAQSQYLRIFSGGTTYHRWQSYYNSSITWEGRTWTYQPFDADGIVAGDVAAEGSLTVGIPVTTNTLEPLREALRRGWLVEIRQYEFDPQLGNNAPQGNQLLIAVYVGEVIGLKGSDTRLEVELGSTLAPIGIQVPPRTMTSMLIGVPCQL